ncbi:AAA family ATPase [Amycolatopsis sp. NPDC051373]|uniref:AAA family ATPase n=1 Tax=Amycolatopsis sp. NPDC051373 TaxID=3155801 RepID=UPI00344EC523
MIEYGENHEEHLDLLADVRDGAWLDEQVFPPLKWAVPGLFPEGGTILVGPPKTGKSYFLGGVLLGIASGTKVLGHIPAGQPRRVLYLALEDGDRRMQSRCRQLLGDEPIPALFHYLTAVKPGLIIATVEAFLRVYADTALVVIDTLGKVMPEARPGESAYQRDYRVAGALKAIADNHPGLALVVVHHDRKAMSEDFVESVSGTNGLAGAMDTIAVLARKRQSSEGVLKITGRDVGENEYALVVDNGAWLLDGEDLEVAAARAQLREHTENLGDRSSEILAFVALHPDGVTAAQVEGKFGKDARRTLARLADSDRLRRPKRGLYTTVPSVPMSQTDNVIPMPLGQRDAWDTTYGEEDAA